MLLAGASCAGKTSLGQAAKDLMGLPWLFWEIDRVAPRLPESAIIQPDQVAGLSAARLEDALAVQDQLLEANLRAVRAYLDVGFNVIAELFLWDRRHMQIAQRALEGIYPLVVELRCSLEVLEQRERARGTTYLGTARAQTEWEWRVSGDLVLDGTRPTAELASELSKWLASTPVGRWPEPIPS